MTIEVEENDYTCGTCKHCAYCANSEPIGTCADWTDPDKDDLTEDERYDGGVMSNFDNENPKEVEDYINEGRGRG